MRVPERGRHRQEQRCYCRSGIYKTCLPIQREKPYPFKTLESQIEDLISLKPHAQLFIPLSVLSRENQNNELENITMPGRFTKC